MMKATTIFTVLVAGGLLVACTPQEKIHPSFGNAVRHNMSIHIINPTPEYSAAQQIPELDGPRAAGAQGRYDKGEVIQPERLRTTESNTR
ncbi:hypothetical protein [Pelagibius marinus]|uniref:hypothetical protein n=1 Tax=Pelagibius marinus TaxID=2762760 RepID=UPI0018733402|nr:hypothetical protein [Pelagibius marinus]